jgi:hypothetical protein
MVGERLIGHWCSAELANLLKVSRLTAASSRRSDSRDLLLPAHESYRHMPKASKGRFAAGVRQVARNAGIKPQSGELATPPSMWSNSCAGNVGKQ